MHNTEKDIDIKDISHVHQVGACVQFSQKCSSQRGFKVVSLQVQMHIQLFCTQHMINPLILIDNKYVCFG